VQETVIGKRGSCHLWCHTPATLMHEGGADIHDMQEMIGHAELSITEIHTRVSINRLEVAHRKTHPAGRATAEEVD
jgi:integrase/recombinase XerD